MQSDWSAKRTCSELASAVEWTATVSTPSSRAARITRSAISPRFAIRMRWNTDASAFGSGPVAAERRSPLDRLEAEEGLAVLHRAAVLDQHLGEPPGLLRLDLVHQ